MRLCLANVQKDSARAIMVKFFLSNANEKMKLDKKYN